MDKIIGAKSNPENKLDIQISDDNELNLKKVIKPNEKKTKPKSNYNPDNTNNTNNNNNNLCIIM